MAQNSGQYQKSLNRKLAPERTALLIIDMQNDFVSNDGYLGLKGQKLDMVQDTVPAIEKLLDFSRKRKMIVVYTKTVHYKYTNTENWVSRTPQKSLDPSICRPDTWGAEIIEELRPLKEEPIIIKHRYDAFLDTDLHLVLRAAGIENIIVVGTQTNLCVDSTARRAYMMDYVTVIAEDCVSTPEVELHQPMLDNFRKNFGYVLRSDELTGMIG